MLVTYRPLCRSGVVSDRTVQGNWTPFWASGLLWIAPAAREAEAAEEGRVFGVGRRGGTEDELRHNRNLVMVDEATGSFWSQILARTICGPLEGSFLSPVPSTVTAWAGLAGATPRHRHAVAAALLENEQGRTAQIAVRISGRLIGIRTDDWVVVHGIESVSESFS